MQSCNPTKKELVGTYLAQNFKSNIDTLILNEDFTYYHSIYDKENQKKIFSNKSEWNYNKGKIILNNYLINLDNIKYYNDSVKFENALSIYKMSVKKDLEGVNLIVFHDLKLYYTKAEN